ncbi:hypothetical protein [Catenovulum maritimum]|uniref:JAB domain-containing protein n=1 Tax=Catenovulum maritimum TaxID=1513271 RepID=A0A0J8GNS4_9ALTE|nr:hypothetical protein [Catenovulum maritimum]KMT64432.1 hypothetical protein XM47_14130 [Catenovulum maritimum]
MNGKVLKQFFNGKNAKQKALNWLNDNVHPLAVKFDVEITVQLSVDFDTWRFGGLGTNYHSHSVDLFSAEQARGWVWGANWHSHASGCCDVFSPDDVKVFNRYASSNITFHMSYQGLDGKGHLVNF